MIIREAEPLYAGEVIEILNQIIKAGIYSSLDTTFSLEEERNFILNFPKRGIFHLAEKEGEIVGFQTVEPFATYTHAHDHVGVIGTMVKLSETRQGIGKTLFKATVNSAREKRYEKFFTYVRTDNERALGFYQNLGFSIVGITKRQVKIKGRYIDEIMIEKFLE